MAPFQKEGPRIRAHRIGEDWPGNWRCPDYLPGFIGG
jgi:hypothetical protein